MPEAKYGPVGALTPVEYEVERLRARTRRREGRRKPKGWGEGIGPQTRREAERRISFKDGEVGL